MGTGPGGTGFDKASSIALDKNGNVYLTGKFTGVATFGDETFTAISDLHYYSYGDAFIAKFNPYGKLQWLKHEGGLGSDAEGTAITVDTDDNIYVAGKFLGSVAFGNTTLKSAGRWNFYVAKYNATGNVLWAKQGNSQVDVNGHSIAVDKAGNVYTSGAFGKEAIFDDKSVIASGDKTHAFLAKYNAEGAIQWLEKGLVANEKSSIVVDGSGNVYMAGNFSATETLGNHTLKSNGGEDVYLIKYSTSGKVEWAKNYGGTLHERGLSIAIDDNDRLYMTGYYQGTSQFGKTNFTSKGFKDVFVAQYDAAGNVLWAKSAGGIGDDQGAGIALDAIGNIYVTGFFRGEATFDNTTLSALGREMMLVKIGMPQEASKAPTAIALSKNTIDENNEIGVSIGVLSATDPDAEAKHTYTLVNGEGDTDNAAFRIEGNELKAMQVFDYEKKNSFSIRVQVVNSLGLTYETVKTITINDAEETVTGIADQVNEQLKMYPNPATSYLVISFEKTIDAVRVVNNFGATVLTQKGGAAKLNLGLDSLASGVYTVFIDAGNQVYARRIVVVK